MSKVKELWTVDRFEQAWAVLEAGTRGAVQLPRELLPNDAKESDVLRVSISRQATRATVTFDIDPDETAARRQRLQEIVRELGKDDPGGDITL